MTNEEFQKLVIEKLINMESKVTSLDIKVSSMDSKVTSLDKKVSLMDSKVTSLDTKLSSIENKLDAVYEQTANLTEFRTEANAKLDFLIEDSKSIHEILGEHEVSIRSLRRRPV